MARYLVLRLILGLMRSHHGLHAKGMGHGHLACQHRLYLVLRADPVHHGQSRVENRDARRVSEALPQPLG
jgi:hypothetical protein